MLRFSRSNRKFRCKSAWFYGAEVELPFSAGAGRKLHCQKRGEITRYCSPARLDLASPGLIPTYASVAGRLQRGRAELLLPLGLVLAR
jgi:hypothetical protein